MPADNLVRVARGDISEWTLASPLITPGKFIISLVQQFQPVMPSATSAAEHGPVFRTRVQMAHRTHLHKNVNGCREPHPHQAHARRPNTMASRADR